MVTGASVVTGEDVVRLEPIGKTVQYTRSGYYSIYHVRSDYESSVKYPLDNIFCTLITNIKLNKDWNKILYHNDMGLEHATKQLN